MHDVPVVLLIVLTNTAAAILMRQFGHANGDEMVSEHWLFGNPANPSGLIVQNLYL